ncbi:MAG TPA: DUF924 family protein [Kofleriaceae bacterium]
MIDDVLAFWFGDEPTPTDATMRRWFMRDAAFDAQIRERFGDLHAKAVAGGLTDWLGSARGTLALLIVIDQFSRNLYRDDPRAFAQDGRALAIARELWGSGRARELTPLERMFVLMPYQHSEDLAMQREGIAEYEKLAAEPGAPPMLKMALDFARKHAEIIERFGRFPHRNEVLGRETTPEERAFLEQPGSRF